MRRVIFPQRQRQVEEARDYARSLSDDGLLAFIKHSHPGSPKSSGGIEELVRRVQALWATTKS